MKLNASLIVESVIITGLDSELFPMMTIKGRLVIPSPTAGKLKTSFTISFEANRTEFDTLREIWHRRTIEELGVQDEEST